MSTDDRTIVRDLARKVAGIAALPIQQERIELWTRLNRLERVRPLIHVQAIAENILQELLPDTEILAQDDFLRGEERRLRTIIYFWENLQDDRVVDNVIPSPIVTSGDVRSANFGIKSEHEHSGRESGAYAIRGVLQDERDIDKIQNQPNIVIDADATGRHYEQLSELYDGILRVEQRGPAFFWLTVMDTFIQWRGIQQMFVDLIDRPAWVHEALERITTGHLNDLDQLEALGILAPGHGNTRLGSGGYGWTDQLPQPGFDPDRVRLKDLWGRCATQIFTEGISPAMHDEFGIQYERRLLERFGLACYGCCEPLHNKMHVVRKIKNLRRVSMSPWVDVDMAAGAVGKDFVYTHKPNPTIVSMESWHPDLAESQLREVFEKTRDNIVEVNLQDLHTVRGEPHRLAEWTSIAMRLSEEFG